MAGKSTLNRLELTPVGADGRPVATRRSWPGTATSNRLFVEAFLQLTPKLPAEIVLDLDATDDPLHGHQLGRFFHGYYKHYCYLPLYIFCGEHLLCAKLRPADIDAAAGSVKAGGADRRGRFVASGPRCGSSCVATAASAART